jgi:polysaccharide biosynthesis protein PslG
MHTFWKHITIAGMALSLAVGGATAAVKTASVPATPKGFGYAGMEVLFKNATDQNKQLSDMQAQGMTWLRVDADWSYIQPNNASSFNWTAYDTLATNATAHNIKLLFILDGTPSWGRAAGCGTDSEWCRPNVAKFTTFTTAVVNRYKTRGVHSYEVWNEPNLQTFWLPTPDANQYTTLLKSVYPAVKAADSTATVITGGLSPLATYAAGGPDIPSTTYESSMYSAGAKNYFDAFGFHPYGYPTPPLEYEDWNGFSILKDTSPSIRSIMVAQGDSAKQVWLTEFGAPTNGPGALATCSDYNYANNPDHVDECLQSKTLSDGIALSKTLSYVGPMFLYGYKDLGTDTSTNENFFGTLRFDGTQKPAYQAVTTAIATP